MSTIGIRSSPPSQSIRSSPPSQGVRSSPPTTINSSQAKITPPSGPARRRHKQILKCTQCRLDKQRCTPVERVWPNRCDRCVKYNHSCSPGLNAREERRRQAPSSFPLSFRTPPPHSEAKSRSETLSPAPNGQYRPSRGYRMRLPSPGTASSTGGSDDDQGDYISGYNGVSILGGNRSGISGYHPEGASPVSHPPHLSGLPMSMMDGHMGASNCNDRGVTDSNNDLTSYLNCLMHSSCDLPSPSISDPTTPIYPLHPGSHSSGFGSYSYFPMDAGQDHPPSRPRSPTSRSLHSRFTQFWAQLNPLGLICTDSPKFVNTVHTIFTHYVPLYAEVDDMVNHALMAFSAADAGINAGGECGRKLNIAGWKHAGRCQRMLGARLGKLKLGSSTPREANEALVVESEVTAVRLGIFLMLFYGLFINDASLLSLTSQLLNRTMPLHSRSSNSPTTIPIMCEYTSLPDGGYRVHLSLDHSPASNEDVEPGMIIGHDTQVFTQIRRDWESQFAPEVLWGTAFQEDEDDEEGEDEEEDDDVSVMGLGCRMGSEDAQRTARRIKPHPELLHLSTAPSTLGNMATAQSGVLITPTSATTLTPGLAGINFSEFGSASYPPPTGAYRVPVSASHSHAHSISQPQLHHESQSSNSTTPPYMLEATEYRRVPHHMSSAPQLSSYSTAGAVPPIVPLAPQIPTDAATSLRHMQRHMHQNLDL